MSLTRLAAAAAAGAALLLLATASPAAAPKAAFAEEVKRDARYFVEVSQLLPYRDGVLGVGHGLVFMKYDSPAAEEFPIAGLGVVTSMGKLGDSILFLGLQGDGKKIGLVLAEEGQAGKAPRTIPLPKELQGPDMVGFEEELFPCVLASSQRQALLMVNAQTREYSVWWLEGETWKSRKLPKVPKFSKEFEPRKIGGRRYLFGDTLFIGWDEGEWGGMLASIDLKDEKAGWVHLSGKEPGDATGIPGNRPVQRIFSTDGKTLVAGTSAELSRRGADGRWSSLMNTKPDQASGPLALPPEVELMTMTADAKGNVHVLAYGAGIFRVEGKAITQVLDHPFTPADDDTGTFGVVCYPLDMAIGKQGDIFVSTNAFGILAFHKEGEAWKGRQILVKEE